MPIKKTIYIFLTIILCLLLALIVYSFLEITYIKYFLSKNLILVSSGAPGFIGCVLPYYIQIVLMLFAVVGGYFLGQFWWRIIYVEKRYGKIK